MAGPTLLNTDVSDEEAEALELRSLVGDAGSLTAEGSGGSVQILGVLEGKNNPQSGDGADGVNDADMAPSSPVSPATTLGKRLRGRPRGGREDKGKWCSLCGCHSSERDPTHQAFEEMGLLEVLAITPETMRWAYPDDAQGRKQGNVDWYCNKTVDACYDGQTCRQVQALIKTDPVSAGKFKERRASLIRVCILRRNEGVTPAVISSAMVVDHVTEASMHHKRHGRAMTLEKYRRQNPSATVLPEQIKTRINSNGVSIEYIKIYNDDEDEWDFTEDEAERVQKRSRLDDGRFIVEDGQLERKHEAVAKCLLERNERGTEVTAEQIKKQKGKEEEERHKLAPTAGALAAGDLPAGGALTRVLGRTAAGMAHLGPESTSAPGPPEGKPKAKAKGKGKAAGRVVNKKKQLEDLQKILAKLTECETYFKQYLKASSPDALKALDKEAAPLKKLSSDKADFLLEMADSEDAQVTTEQSTRLADMIEFLKVAPSLAKSWVRFNHSKGEKHRLELCQDWAKFKVCVHNFQTEVPDWYPLRKAIIVDLVKGIVAPASAQGDWKAVAGMLAIEYLVREGLTSVDAGELQKKHIFETLRVLARKCCNDTDELRDEWMKFRNDIGVVADADAAWVLKTFSDALNIDNESELSEAPCFNQDNLSRAFARYVLRQ